MALLLISTARTKKATRPLADAENEDHSDIIALLEEHQK